MIGVAVTKPARPSSDRTINNLGKIAMVVVASKEFRGWETGRIGAETGLVEGEMFVRVFCYCTLSRNSRPYLLLV